jgi:hypothetical protein
MTLARRIEAVPASIHALHEQLAEHVAQIRKLGKRMLGDIIEIGRLLTACHEIVEQTVGHGGWLPFLDREFSEWSVQTLHNSMNVYAASLKFQNFRNLSLPYSALYLISAPNTPHEVQQQVIDRAEAGERFSVAQIKNMIAVAKKAAKPRKPTAEPEPESDDLPDQNNDVEASANARKAEAEIEEQQEFEDEDVETKTDEPTEPPLEKSVMKAIDALVAAVRGMSDLQIENIVGVVCGRLRDAMPDDGTLRAYWGAQRHANRVAGAKRAAETRRGRQQRDAAAQKLGQGDE